jgi:DNA-binding transcriptional LysR family regulator
MQALPVVLDFLASYPDIRVRLQLSDRLVNLLEEHVDLAVRMGTLPDSSMVATRVGVIRQVVCASPGYLKKRGVPKKPADVSSHECIGFEGLTPGTNWNFRVDGMLQTIPVPARLIVTSVDAAVLAALAGAGLARVLSYQIDDLVKARSLVTVMEAYEPPPLPVHVIYPSQRQVPLKLRAFLDFAIPRFRERMGYKA